MLNSSYKLTGELLIQRFDLKGKETFSRKFKNLVVQAGKNFSANALVAASPTPFDYMAIGSGATPAASPDTALAAEVYRVAAPGTAPLNIATWVGNFGAGNGTGTIQEAGIFNAAAAGTMLSRVVFAAIGKGPTDSIMITWTVTAG